MSWVLVSQQLLTNGNELMIVPAVASIERPSKIKRLVYLVSDVAYYAARYLLVSRFL